MLCKQGVVGSSPISSTAGPRAFRGGDDPSVRDPRAYCVPRVDPCYFRRASQTPVGSARPGLFLLRVASRGSR